MILVIGSVRARPDSADEALRLSIEHVRRSRLEQGCISHSVHRDAEEPDRLVFVERWQTIAALKAHFAVPEARGFVRALAGLAVEPPEMTLYDAAEVVP